MTPKAFKFLPVLHICFAKNCSQEKTTFLGTIIKISKLLNNHLHLRINISNSTIITFLLSRIHPQIQNNPSFSSGRMNFSGNFPKWRKLIYHAERIESRRASAYIKSLPRRWHKNSWILSSHVPPFNSPPHTIPRIRMSSLEIIMYHHRSSTTSLSLSLRRKILTFVQEMETARFGLILGEQYTTCNWTIRRFSSRTRSILFYYDFLWGEEVRRIAFMLNGLITNLDYFETLFYISM